jgi:hypothetical protein
MDRLSEPGCDEWSCLIGTYTMTTSWQEVMLHTEKLMAGRGKDGTRAEKLLARIDELCLEEGETLDREALMLEARGSSPELDLSARHLREEIATLRFLLRNMFNAAAEADENKAYLGYVQHYGRGCVRLARLLRRQKEGGQGNLEAYVDQLVDEAIEEVLAGWAAN